METVRRLSDELQTVVDGDGWQHVMGHLSRAVQARSFSVTLYDSDVGVVHYAADGASAASITELVADGSWRSSGFLRRMQPLGPTVAVLPDPRACPGDRVADSMTRAGLLRHLAVLFRAPDTRPARITFARGAEAPDFGAREHRLLQTLTPALHSATIRSITVAERAGAAAFAALARAGAAAALLDIGGRLVAATDDAALDMAPFRLAPAGRLQLCHPHEQALFAEALRQAAGGEAPPAIVAGKGGGEALSLHLAPASAPAGSGPCTARAAVLMLVRPLPRARPALAALTPAERALAQLVAEGVPMAAAAQRRGVTLKTARTYMERVHAKTGVTSRAELVALMLDAPLGGR